MLQSDAGHALAQSALVHKILLQPDKLLVDQIIGLMNETERDVGHYFGRAGLDELAKVLVTQRSLAAQVADEFRLLGVLIPDLQVAGAEVIFVIVKQFLKAGAGYIRELDLHFLRGQPGLAALQDILLARPGALDHLVYGAVAPGEEIVREAEGDVINHLGFLERKEGLVIAAWGGAGVRDPPRNGNYGKDHSRGAHALHSSHASHSSSYS